MTFQNDPNNRTPERKTNYGWIIGGLVAAGLIFGIFSMYRHQGTYTVPTAGGGTTTTPRTHVTPSVPTTTGSTVTDSPSVAPAS